jgi:hypothetical protein
MESKEPPAQLGWVTGLPIAVLAIIGSALIIVSMAGWQNEFRGEKVVGLGEGSVTDISERFPYDTTSKRSVYTCYPVFEYRDRSGRTRELTGVMAFRGYFNKGDKVQMAEIDGRVVVMDKWFRSQRYVHLFLGGLMILGAIVAILYRLRVFPW